LSDRKKTVYIAGLGIISPLGCGIDATEQTLRKNSSAVAPLDSTVFSIQNPPPLPVGQVLNLADSPLPRTHRLTIAAAQQAMDGYSQAPDAVIIGTTTGGILTTEELLAAGEKNSEKYCHHGLTTVAEELAGVVHCTGPALTVSTACSSGTVAISMALKMLQSGEAEWVLAGGADSLCRLTYFGFHSLQLVDPEGGRPLDTNRKGMSVAEGAGLLLLSTIKPERPLGQILGCGLTCDAYHPAAPHPDGKGAFQAMRNAINDAGSNARGIDYINLHGTGTPDNDLAESKAIRSLFANPPPLSSIKGATGHSLAASGAIEAVISAICVQQGFLPANTGCAEPDPELLLTPILTPANQPVSTVLSNSFGFGGNNACVIIAQTDSPTAPCQKPQNVPLSILGKACITGAGHTQDSLESFSKLAAIAGTLDLETISEQLPARKVRRLKRFSRIALALATAAKEDSGLQQSPHSVFMGSGWGALSETYDFIDKLQSSNEKFPSPIDFVGSVHNSAAGQVAIMHDATGANITSSGGDYSFEQALLVADSFLDEDSPSAFVLAADEAHEKFSPLFDPSVTPDVPLADGGGGFYLTREAIPGRISIQLKCYQKQTDDILETLIAALNVDNSLQNDCKMILAGIPAADAAIGEQQLDSFMQKTGLDIPVIHYRKFTGEFASASGVAAVMAAHLLEEGVVAADKKILVLGFGKYITAMELARQE
jgi:3-oxoacyl-[acyl-carrier-protein] synthase I